MISMRKACLFFTAARPECTTDPECPLHLACIQEKCQNPCSRFSCGENAECSVRNHRATCTCRTGYEGDPYTICIERKTVWFENPSAVVTQPSISIAAGCKSDFECPDDRACIKRECQDPCLFETCGANAYCKAKAHRAICLCLENHKGDPYRQCTRYECLSDPDCPTTLACRQEKCVDPCQCAQNADCSPRNHKGICTCKTGYTGDPYGVACVKSKSENFRPMACPRKGVITLLLDQQFLSPRWRKAAMVTVNVPARRPALTESARTPALP